MLIRVLPFKGPMGAVVPNAGDTFFINGRPFAGTGNGWNKATGILDAKDANNHEFALLPNPAFYSPTGDYKADSTNTTWSGPVPFGGWGGANIDYSVPDYQNMYMAWVSTTSTSSIPVAVLPSYHRPDLINYWMKRETHHGMEQQQCRALAPNLPAPESDRPSEFLRQQSGLGRAAKLHNQHRVAGQWR